MAAEFESPTRSSEGGPVRTLVWKNGAAVIALLALLFWGDSSRGQLHIDVEGSWVSSGYNDVRIPGDGGTDVSLTDDLETDPKIVGRARLGYTFSERHTFSALYAPLTLKASGVAAEPIVFENEEFPAGTDIEASYTFNSYRLTYRYEFPSSGRFDYGLGFTAKIRDAEVVIEGGGKRATKTNVGFVPLLNFRVRARLNDALALTLEGDALAAPQGRAEDVSLALVYRASEAIDVRLGYRIVEGGADNDEVYNFTLLNYASLGVGVNF